MTADDLQAVVVLVFCGLLMAMIIAGDRNTRTAGVILAVAALALRALQLAFDYVAG